jgi:hypothetical protein
LSSEVWDPAIQIPDDPDRNSAGEYWFQYDRVMPVRITQQCLQSDQIPRLGEANDPLRPVGEILRQLHEAGANSEEMDRRITDTV